MNSVFKILFTALTIVSVSLSHTQNALAQQSTTPREGGHWDQEGNLKTEHALLEYSVRLAVRTYSTDSGQKCEDSSLAKIISKQLAVIPNLDQKSFDNSGVKHEALSDEELRCYEQATKLLTNSRMP